MLPLYVLEYLWLFPCLFLSHPLAASEEGKKGYSCGRNTWHCPLKPSQYKFWDTYLHLPRVKLISLLLLRMFISWGLGEGWWSGVSWTDIGCDSWPRPPFNVLMERWPPGVVVIFQNLFQANTGLPLRWPVSSTKQYRHSRLPPPWWLWPSLALGFLFDLCFVLARCPVGTVSGGCCFSSRHFPVLGFLFLE